MIVIVGVSACGSDTKPTASQGASTPSESSEPVKDPFSERSQFWVFQAKEDATGDDDWDNTMFWFYNPTTQASQVLRAPFPTDSSLNVDRELAIGFDADHNVSIANIWTGTTTTLDMAELTGNFRADSSRTAEFDKKDANLVHVTTTEYVLWDIDLRHPEEAANKGTLLGTDENMTACDEFYYPEVLDWQEQLLRSNSSGEVNDYAPLEGDPVMAPTLEACYARTGVLRSGETAFYDSFPSLPSSSNAWTYGTEDQAWSFQSEGEVEPMLRLYEASSTDSDWTLSKAQVAGEFAIRDSVGYRVMAAPSGVAPAITR